MRASVVLALILVTPGAAPARELGAGFLRGDERLGLPVDMAEFAPPDDAAPPRNAFSGRLRLVEPERSGRFRIVLDLWDRHGEIGKSVQHLPEFDFAFVQRGSDLVPLSRGVIRREHPYWEIILQPGRAWDEPADGGFTRVALPFALQERAANCTHNGVMTWLFDGEGNVSRVAYQVVSETCGYFKFDMWGTVTAEYRPRDFGTEAAAAVARFDAHREDRLPVRPVALLAVDFPGTRPQAFGVDDGIDPADMSVFGMLVDGAHYRSECHTRQGPYPFCASLPLPSYSTAKSIFAGVAVMRLEELYPGTAAKTIASLVDECDTTKWRDVTIGDALDMATGNYGSTAVEKDENSIPHRRFVFDDEHRSKVRFACRHFPRKADPGTQFVYHTSDTYLVGSALQALLRQEEVDGDLYEAVIVDPIWRRLNLSPLLDDTKRTYDEYAQPFTGYGLTYEADDIVRIAAWLHRGARLDGEPALDTAMLDAALQRSPGDRGLPAASENVRYNLGFWAYDAGPLLGCSEPAWIPFMSGVSGITVAMFPNGIVYYYFSDGYVFRWQSAIRAAHTIRNLCR